MPTDYLNLPKKQSTLATALRAHALNNTSGGITFCEYSNSTLDWEQLEIAVEECAAQFVEAWGLPRESIVLLCGPNSRELVINFLAVQRIGAIPSIIAPNWQAIEPFVDSVSRKANICQPSAVLLDTSFPTEHLVNLRTALDSAGLRAVRVDRLATGQPIGGGSAERAPASLAFLQFTSGSVLEPRAVQITHENLFANLQAMASNDRWTSEDIIVCWLPLFHDMGLVGHLAGAVSRGCKLVLTDPTAFLRRPSIWLRLITQHRATLSTAPNSAYALCAHKLPESHLEGLDLSSWLWAYNGSEPIDNDAVQAFVRRFQPYGFRPSAIRNVYGMAETVLATTFPPMREEVRSVLVDSERLSQDSIFVPAQNGASAREIVSVGCAFPEHAVEIRDTDRQPVAAGTVGEVWVKGPSVMRGYLGEASPIQDGWLPTGDLGFLHEEELYVCGRKKELIIKAGRNIYPADVEAFVGKVDGVRFNASVAFEFEKDGRAFFGLAVESRVPEAEHPRIEQAIRKVIIQSLAVAPDCIWILKPHSIPRTTSGKLRRRESARLAASGKWGLGMGFEMPNDSAARAAKLLRWLRQFFANRVNSSAMDERRMLSPHIVLSFGKEGLFGLLTPVQHGGMGLTLKDALNVIEQLAAMDQSLATLVGIQNALVLKPLLEFANPVQTCQYVHDLASGRLLGSLAVTEPGAGSNPRAMAATALRTQDGWVLDGRKIWIGVAAWASVLIVLARELDQTGKETGIRAFLVPAETEGVLQGSEAPTMGLRALVQNELIFKQVKLPESAALGPIGSGYSVAQSAFRLGRVFGAASALGAMRRAVQLMTRYATRRPIATGLLLDNAYAQERISSACAAVESCAALLDELSSWFSQDQNANIAAYSILKTVIPEMAWTVLDDLAQLLGGRGYIETNEVPRMLRDLRVLRVFEGPTEALCYALGNELLSRSSDIIDIFERLKAQDQLDRIEDWIDTVFQASLAEPDKQRCILRAGRLVGLAALFAVTRRRCGGSAPSAFWAEEILSREMPTPDEFLRSRAWIRTSADLIDVANGITEPLGEWECMLPGLDTELDPLLRPAGQAIETQPEVRSAIEATSPEVPDDSEAQKIARWMLKWLGNGSSETAMNIGRLHIAELGIDSLKATQLAIAIEERFNVSLHEDVLFSDATVLELARHIALEREASIERN
jgi:acyl-CoA synthetase (AMP-forming)/AMP-acid ligase II/alkylation response protein AidB-like acyl-CoA dehydrogenase/acyl carrier protein